MSRNGIKSTTKYTSEPVWIIKKKKCNLLYVFIEMNKNEYRFWTDHFKMTEMRL